ncbi:MAG: hypothetical protein AB7F83_09305, partial [Lysobacterales bacterium]
RNGVFGRNKKPGAVAGFANDNTIKPGPGSESFGSAGTRGHARSHACSGLQIGGKVGERVHG